MESTIVAMLPSAVTPASSDSIVAFTAPHFSCPEHGHERDPEFGCPELDASDSRRVDRLSGGADHEQVAETSVEHDLGSHARVDASEDDRERFLTRPPRWRATPRSGEAGGCCCSRIVRCLASAGPGTSDLNPPRRSVDWPSGPAVTAASSPSDHAWSHPSSDPVTRGVDRSSVLLLSICRSFCS